MVSVVGMYGFSLTLDSPFVNDLAHVSLVFLWCEASALHSTYRLLGGIAINFRQRPS